MSQRFRDMSSDKTVSAQRRRAHGIVELLGDGTLEGAGGVAVQMTQPLGHLALSLIHISEPTRH